MITVLLLLALATPPSEEGFARYLLEQGEPELALGVLQRLVDLNPAASDARQRLFRLYLDRGRLAAAEKLVDGPLLQADLDAAKGDAAAAYTGYSRLARASATRQLALRRLVGLALEQRWWAQALTSAEALEPKDQGLVDELQAWRARPVLSADHARLFSTFLPGSGQLYAGEPAAAVGSLGVNGAFGAAALVTAWRGDWLGASALIGVGSRYYFGGIQHAGRYAEARLDAEDRAFVRRLREARPWL